MNHKYLKKLYYVKEFVTKGNKLNGRTNILQNVYLYELYSYPSTVRMFKQITAYCIQNYS